MDTRQSGADGCTDRGSAEGSVASPVEAMNRFLATMVKDTWEDLDRALRITENTPEFSGILPLGDPTLAPYLDKPGVFFILGPRPDFPLLDIGASRGPIGFVLRSRIEEHPEKGFGWRWEGRSDLPPTFAAIATMEDHWAFAPPLRALLARRLNTESSTDQAISIT